MAPAPPGIPQTDPGAVYRERRGRIDEAILRVLASGSYILGPEVEAFETEFAAYLGVTECVGVASGTDALELALRACGIGPGDLVFTVSLTAVATISAIDRCGATAVLLDVDDATRTLDPQRLEDALQAVRPGDGVPAAIVPVHLHGCPADLRPILSIAERFGLPVIEDCAQAHGAERDGRRVGTWGDLAAFSFYPTKNLGAFGDAGLVATRDRELATRVRHLRQYGWDTHRVSLLPGANSRLDEIQAAILRVLLPDLDADNEHRRRCAARYTDRLGQSNLSLPVEPAGARHVFHQYAVRHHERDRLASVLLDAGVGTAVHYAVPVHRHPGYAPRVRTDTLSHTDAIAATVLSLPMHAHLDLDHVDEVADLILRFQHDTPLRRP